MNGLEVGGISRIMCYVFKFKVGIMRFNFFIFFNEI